MIIFLYRQAGIRIYDLGYDRCYMSIRES